MGLPQVLIEELNVAASDVERCRAMSENPLQTEDIAAVGQERSGERVSQHVW